MLRLGEPGEHLSVLFQRLLYPFAIIVEDVVHRPVCVCLLLSRRFRFGSFALATLRDRQIGTETGQPRTTKKLTGTLPEVLFSGSTLLTAEAAAMLRKNYGEICALRTLAAQQIR